MKLEAAWANGHAVLQTVIEILRSQHIEAYLVGGAVRDLLLGRQTVVDLDFVVPKRGLKIARQVANTLEAAFYPLDAERGTGRIVIDPDADSGGKKFYLDFATFRGSTLLEDLQDRDFTINAIAIQLTDPPQLIDPFQGQHDLQQRQIQAVTATTFQHDPVRVLRAVRQAAELGFAIEPQTRRSLQQAAPNLGLVSLERQRDELLKLLNTPAPGQAVRMLQSLGVLSHFLPDIEAMIGVNQSSPHYLDVFDHTGQALDVWSSMLEAKLPGLANEVLEPVKAYLDEEIAGDLTPRQLLPLALLWHDAGKPLTRTEEEGPPKRSHFFGHEQKSAKLVQHSMKRFRFSNQAIEFVGKIVAHHMRPLLLAQADRVSRRAIYRFFRDTGTKPCHAGVAVTLHALADHGATYPPGQGEAAEAALLGVVNRLISTYFEQYNQLIDPPVLLTGHDLIELFGLTEGRLIGILLNRLKEAQAAGQIQSKAEAVTFIQQNPELVDFQKGQSSG